MKDTKTKCECGCGMTLYTGDFGDGQVVVGVEANARKSFKRFKGVIIDKKKLLKLLK